MKELDDLIRRLIDGGQIGAFVQIAMLTSKCQLRGIIAATVLARNVVFDMESKERLIILPNVAIFTAIPRPIPYKFSRRGIHQAAVSPASSRRALDCMIARTFAAET